MRVHWKEALELLNSYNTGHDGGMSSGRNNSPKDMLARLETMVLMGAEGFLWRAIRSQIRIGARCDDPSGAGGTKKRRVFWIVEVDGYMQEGRSSSIRLYGLGEQGLEKKGELKIPGSFGWQGKKI